MAALVRVDPFDLLEPLFDLAAGAGPSDRILSRRRRLGLGGREPLRGCSGLLVVVLVRASPVGDLSPNGRLSDEVEEARRRRRLYVCKLVNPE
jgi:hypothetical protein